MMSFPFILKIHSSILSDLKNFFLVCVLPFVALKFALALRGGGG